jgi:BlaI family transcriptional regulator, penicillinase repressor
MDRPKRRGRQAAHRVNPDFELRGPLQVEVMGLLWKLGPATINDIRSEQRQPKRRSYTTIQTVLDRLVDRGLVERKRRGKPYVYRPRYDEAELLALSISEQLAASSSPETRRNALVRLLNELSEQELQHLLRTIRQPRKE